MIYGIVNKSIKNLKDRYLKHEGDENEVEVDESLNDETDFSSKSVFEGVEDKEIALGEKFIARSGVIARGKKDNTLKGKYTSKIKIEGHVDINTPGVYNLVYSVIGDGFKETKINRKITVSNSSEIEETPKDIINNNLVKEQKKEEVANKILEEKVKAKLPKFTGLDELILEVGDTFEPKKGIRAVDYKGFDLTAQIRVIGVGRVDTSSIGRYNVTYSVICNEGIESRVVRNIIVKNIDNTPPTITGSHDLSINLGDKFLPRVGVRALSNKNINLTASMHIEGTVNSEKAGVYKIKYTVSDEKNLTTIATRTITVIGIPNGAPDLRIRPLRVRQGSSSNEVNLSRGIVSARDSDYVDLSSRVQVISMDLDLNRVGDYELIYTVTDDDGNRAEKIGTITVE